MKILYSLTIFLLLRLVTGATTLIVTDTSASSPFSLAQAIANANAIMGRDTIEFDIPITNPVIVTDSLPDITDTLFVNGFSQPGTNTSNFPNNLLKLTGTRGIVIRSPGCYFTGFSFSNTTEGITVIADSLKNISNTIISYCIIVNSSSSSIGISIYSNSITSLNSSGILIDSVWVFVSSGQTAINIQATSTSDITDVTISGSRFQSYSCPAGCYAGIALHINRQNTTTLNPNYHISNCEVLGKIGLEGYLDNIYVGHSLFMGGCDYLVFENCSMNNSLVEYNRTVGGAASCGTFPPNVFLCRNFLPDSTRNIHVINNSFQGGNVQFDFSGNNKKFDSIFFEHDTISGGIVSFEKKNGGNADTVYINNLFIRNNHPENYNQYSPSFHLNFSGASSISDVQIQNNLLTKPYASIAIDGDTASRYNNINITNNTLNVESGTGIQVVANGGINKLTISDNSISRGWPFSAGIAINSEGEISQLRINDNSLDSLGMGLSFYNKFRINGEVKRNDISHCGEDPFSTALDISAAYVDTGYGLEIDSNNFVNNFSHAIDIHPSYLPPAKNLNKMVFLGNSISNSLRSSGINRQSQHDTASCITCIPSPNLVLADYSLGTTTVEGNIQGDSSAPYLIEFFRNTIADTSGFGEGEFFINRDTITTDSTGLAVFTVPLNGNFLGQFITATATSLVRLQTSEFSNSVPVNSISKIPEQLQNGFSVFPNPITDKLQLFFTCSKIEKVYLKIYDMTGRIVFSKETISGKQQVDLSFLESGMYVLTLQTEKENWMTRLVKE